jgi:hypothetical protein
MHLPVPGRCAAQYGVEAVEKASELDDGFGLDVVVVQAREQAAEAAHLVLDLSVRTAQRGSCVATVRSVDDWDEEFFVGALVRGHHGGIRSSRRGRDTAELRYWELGGRHHVPEVPILAPSH